MKKNNFSIKNVNNKNGVIVEDNSTKIFNGLSNEKIQEELSKGNNELIEFEMNQYLETYKRFRKLPPELEAYINISPKIINGKLEMVSEYKNEVGKKLYPRNFKISFDPVNTNFNEFGSKDRKAILEESMGKQKSIIIKNAVINGSYLGDIEDPAPSSLFMKNQVIPMLIMQPHKLSEKFPISFYIEGKERKFEIPYIQLEITKNYDNEIILSNKNDKSSIFSLSLKFIILEKTDEYMNFKLNFCIKLKETSNCEIIKKFLNYQFILNEEKIIFKMKNLKEDIHLFDTVIDGRKDDEFDKDYATKLENLLDKLIYIQNHLNIKFNFDEDTLYKYIKNINKLYGLLKNGQNTYIISEELHFEVKEIKNDLKDSLSSSNFLFATYPSEMLTIFEQSVIVGKHIEVTYHNVYDKRIDENKNRIYFKCKKIEEKII